MLKDNELLSCKNDVIIDISNTVLKYCMLNKKHFHQHYHIIFFLIFFYTERIPITPTSTTQGPLSASHDDKIISAPSQEGSFFVSYCF